jgi:hypothetical protein
MTVFLRSAALMLAVATVLTLAVGCGDKAAVVPVEGTLKMKGKPLANVKVDFLPESAGPRSSGVTDSNGRYTLTCDDGRPGAVVGMHRVVAVDLTVYGDKPIPRGHEEEVLLKPSRLPAGYGEVSKTPWKKEVGGSSNVIDLEVIAP